MPYQALNRTAPNEPAITQQPIQQFGGIAGGIYHTDNGKLITDEISPSTTVDINETPSSDPVENHIIGWNTPGYHNYSGSGGSLPSTQTNLSQAEKSTLFTTRNLAYAFVAALGLFFAYSYLKK